MPAGIETTAPKKDWVNIGFLFLTPIIGIGGTAWYTARAGFSLWMLGLLLLMYTPVGLSICAGYHRYFSHRSYRASRPVQLFFAVFGAMAAQNSILSWCSGHRRHHRYVDREWDPYNIQRGFWWAHILWVFYREPDRFDNVVDLQANPIVRWQHRWTKALLLGGGFGIPLAVGAAFGDPLAGLLWGGFLRLVIVHHTTFFVNSLAHSVGKAEFDSAVSARDNWAVALVTFGEGYHSFHHRFPSDFRNGIRWYHWDPGKWLIVLLRSVGLASGLRVTAAPHIEEARLKAAAERMEPKLSLLPEGFSGDVRRRLAGAREAVENARLLWRRQAQERLGRLKTWKLTRRSALRHVREARLARRAAMRLLSRTA
jgi:stearoyl-CoA desaturase (delta-9 desaturase)